MQDIHRFLKLRHIKHTITTAIFPHPDFIDTNPDCGHRFPVIRLFALLHLKELMPCGFSSLVGKLPEIIS